MPPDNIAKSVQNRVFEKHMLQYKRNVRVNTWLGLCSWLLLMLSVSRVPCVLCYIPIYIYVYIYIYITSYVGLLPTRVSQRDVLLTERESACTILDHFHLKYLYYAIKYGLFYHTHLIYIL